MYTLYPLTGTPPLLVGTLQAIVMLELVAASRVGVDWIAPGTVAQAKYWVLDCSEIPIELLACNFTP